MDNSFRLMGRGSEDKTLRVWDTTTGECLQALQEHNDVVKGVGFRCNDGLIWSGSADKSVYLWDFKQNKILPNRASCRRYGRLFSFKCFSWNNDRCFCCENREGPVILILSLTPAQALPESTSKLSEKSHIIYELNSKTNSGTVYGRITAAAEVKR